MDKRYARLKRKMLLLVVAGTLAALAVGMLLLHTVVDGVLQDPFAPVSYTHLTLPTT